MSEEQLAARVGSALIGVGYDDGAEVVATSVREGRYIDVVFEDGQEAILTVDLG